MRDLGDGMFAVVDDSPDRIAPKDDVVPSTRSCMQHCIQKPDFDRAA